MLNITSTADKLTLVFIILKQFLVALLISIPILVLNLIFHYCPDLYYITKDVFVVCCISLCKVKKKLNQVPDSINVLLFS